jgi:hypothetical protein
LEQAQLVPGEAMPVDYYQPATGAAAAALTVAQHAWNHALSTAQGLKADLAAAIDVCVKAINDQAHTRFTPNPSGISGFLSGVKNFVKDHAAALSKLSSVLKGVSMVTGMLSFVPGLAVVSVVAGGLALGLDAATMWAAGHYDPTTLAMDVVAIVPGAGQLASKGLAGIRAAKAAKAVEAVEEEVQTDASLVARSESPPPTDSVQVHRVESPGNERIAIGPSGDVSIKGDSMLFINVGDRARAETFLTQRLDQGYEGTVLKSFDIEKSYAEDLASRAVSERQARMPGVSVIRVDTTKTASSYGLRSSEFAGLQRAILPGSGS